MYVFIDYTKAFDKVRHEDLMDILLDLDLEKKTFVRLEICTAKEQHA